MKLFKCVPFLLVLSSFFLELTSCSKDDDIQLVDQAYKSLTISNGGDFTIPILGDDNWSIQSVYETPTKEILDTNDKPMKLEESGTIEASNGWLSISRYKENAFTVSLKENFDKTNVRQFTIMLNKSGKHDYIVITQRHGEYKVNKSAFKEIKREIYVSDKDCGSIVLRNYSTQLTELAYTDIFKNVVQSSDFESDDYGAFDWMPEKGIQIEVPDLMINDTIRWSDKCTYKSGIFNTAYKTYASNDKILVQPNSSARVKGEVTYCKRVCNYTLTIQNIDSHTTINLNGVWTQIVPISTNTIIN